MQKQIISTILAAIVTCVLLSATAAASEQAASLDHFQKANVYQTGIFTDVSDTDWFSGNVQAAYEYGLMEGSGTKFSPKNSITLAQVLAIACRMSSIYQTGSADFEQGNPWYQVYADYAVEKGIISSNSNRNYNAAATRREVAEMLAKALPDALTETNTIADGAIPDVAAGSAGYNEIYALYRAGIAGGSGSNHAFSPDTQISRAETAAMITRMINASPRLELQLQPVTVPETPSQASNTELTVDPLWKGKAASGAIPAISDQATSENVLALLDQYDPDGAFILRKAGTDFMNWFSTGTLLSRIDTAVHEQCHVLSLTASALSAYSLDSTFPVSNATLILASGDGHTENYYTGNGTIVPVSETKIYPSREMVPYIPAELQNTDRFSIYVNSTGGIDSVNQGIYGLMDEFTAYSWGLNNTVALYEYYKAHVETANDWYQYVSEGANDRLAYAEFRYYILTYMLYAKDHYPDVYQGIANNQDFKKAFRLVDTRYTDSVQKYENSLSNLNQFLSRQGYEVNITGDQFSISNGGNSSSNSSIPAFDWSDFFSNSWSSFESGSDYFSGDWSYTSEERGDFTGSFQNSGIGIFTSDYQKLMNAMKAEKYQAELAVLKG